jgi:uncharacterized membrane protein (UPF0127 family)
MAVARRLRRLERTVILGVEVPVATTTISRLLGLAFLRRGSAGPGLLIPHCRSVHSFGMRFPLDLVFLDRERRAIEVRRGVPPSRFASCDRADAVLEIPARMEHGAGGEAGSRRA